MKHLLLLLIVCATSWAQPLPLNHQKVSGADSLKAVGRINIYMDAGNDYMKTNNFIDAQQSYEAALSWAENTFNDKSVHLIRPLAGLVNVYDKQHLRKLAIVYINRLIPLLELHYKDNDKVIQVWKDAKTRLEKS